VVLDDKPKRPDGMAKNTGELKFQDYNFENPPQFRKDGDLRFYDSNTQEELFHIETEVASTDESRARGLMFRKEMLENQGMFFLFPKDEIQGFLHEKHFNSFRYTLCKLKNGNC